MGRRHSFCRARAEDSRSWFYNKTNVKNKTNSKHILNIMWPKNSSISERNAIKWSEYKNRISNKRKMGRAADSWGKSCRYSYLLTTTLNTVRIGEGTQRYGVISVWGAVGNSGWWSNFFTCLLVQNNAMQKVELLY